jgi:hypothetical protein
MLASFTMQCNLFVPISSSVAAAIALSQHKYIDTVISSSTMSSAPSPWERIGEIDRVHERGKKDQEVPVMRAPAVGGAGVAMCVWSGVPGAWGKS